MSSRLEKILSKKNDKKRLTENRETLKTLTLDELISEAIDDGMFDDDSTDGLDEFDGGDEGGEETSDDFGSEDDFGGEEGGDAEGVTVDHAEDDTITITISKSATVTDLIQAFVDVLSDSPAGDELLSAEEIEQAENEVADELAAEEGDDAGEEPAEGEGDDEDMSGMFMDEDEEEIDDNGSSGNVKANGSVSAPKRTVASKEYQNGKTVKSDFDQTQGGEGTPATGAGAPERKIASKSYQNGKTVKSNLNPGRKIVGG